MQATLIATNFLLHAYRIPSLTAGMEVVYTPNLTYINSGLNCDTFNIIHINNGQQLTIQEITEVVQFFRQRELAYCIWVSQENLTAPVLRFFNRLNIQQQNADPGMVLDLSTYQPQENESHQHIRIVFTPEMLADYAQVIAANWSPPDLQVMDYYRQTATHYLNPDLGIVLAVFYRNEIPVATIELFPSDAETIGLYGLATLANQRGKGIGSAMLTYALNLAQSLGYKNAVLQASQDGIEIYKKMGFQTFTQYFEFA